jgi:hypothetical protein
MLHEASSVNRDAALDLILSPGEWLPLRAELHVPRFVLIFDGLMRHALTDQLRPVIAPAD